MTTDTEILDLLEEQLRDSDAGRYVLARFGQRRLDRIDPISPEEAGVGERDLTPPRSCAYCRWFDGGCTRRSPMAATSYRVAQCWESYVEIVDESSKSLRAVLRRLVCAATTEPRWTVCPQEMADALYAAQRLLSEEDDA